ncbi:MAG: phosphopantetheine-binding protein [Pseudomonadota bacterium]
MSRAIQNVIVDMLQERDKPADIAPNDAIFTSGLLDSLAATELIMTLEGEFGLDLADADFDISQLDTISSLEALVGKAA